MFLCYFFVRNVHKTSRLCQGKRIAQCTSFEKKYFLRFKSGMHSYKRKKNIFTVILGTGLTNIFLIKTIVNKQML